MSDNGVRLVKSNEKLISEWDNFLYTEYIIAEAIGDNETKAFILDKVVELRMGNYVLSRGIP